MAACCTVGCGTTVPDLGIVYSCIARAVITGLRVKQSADGTFLWQGTGLVIFFFGAGYAIAATNPGQHWSVLLIGLTAKVLGPVGMLWSVIQGDVPHQVLYLIPINDLIWWLPFTMILRDAFMRQRGEDSSVLALVSTIRP